MHCRVCRSFARRVGGIRGDAWHARTGRRSYLAHGRARVALRSRAARDVVHVGPTFHLDVMRACRAWLTHLWRVNRRGYDVAAHLRTVPPWLAALADPDEFDETAGISVDRAVKLAAAVLGVGVVVVYRNLAASRPLDESHRAARKATRAVLLRSVLVDLQLLATAKRWRA